MAEKLAQNVFRSTFKVVDKDTLRWFPGHMDRGMKTMQHKLRSVDCIIEVHDARIPFSGRNTDFKYKISGVKPHILVLNKIDLINTRLVSQIKDKLYNEHPHVLFTNCKDNKCRGVRRLFPLAQELISNSERYNRSGSEEFCVMIIGIPNVGKSSLVNRCRNIFIRKGNANPVGATPGVTRRFMTKVKISEDPLFYMYDTPGILTPKIDSTEVGLKLACCNTLQDHLVGQTILADYLLYWLNKNNKFKYVEYFELENANDNILEVLTRVALKYDQKIRLKNIIDGGYMERPNFEQAARIFIQKFRNGDLGRIMLDQDLLQ